MKEKRFTSEEGDIVWLLGTVIHLLLFRQYPMEQWLEQQQIAKLAEGQNNANCAEIVGIEMAKLVKMKEGSENAMMPMQDRVGLPETAEYQKLYDVMEVIEFKSI